MGTDHEVFAKGRLYAVPSQVMARLAERNVQRSISNVIQAVLNPSAFSLAKSPLSMQSGFCTGRWYNHRRGHSACRHLPPIRESDNPATFDLVKHKLTCIEELGGHLKSYRAAA